ncbi:MAG: NAD(P)H-dependent oxidoreductase [Candidatus Hodarchaeota archaeon]
MRISVILGHPKKGSFNHAIAETAIRALRNNGHKVFFHDLYEEKFDPILLAEELPQDAILNPAIQTHCEELVLADGLVIIHPNWWGQPPTILKGWVDRVFRPGVAYKFAEDDNGEVIPTGLLKAELAVIFNTSDTPPERELAVFGDPLETLWKKCILRYCGVKKIYRTTYGVIATSTLSQRRKWLKDVENIVTSEFPS